jgi:hypothetical protein
MPADISNIVLYILIFRIIYTLSIVEERIALNQHICNNNIERNSENSPVKSALKNPVPGGKTPMLRN